MAGSWFQRLSDGLSKTREQLTGQLNVLLQRGPDLDEEFWEQLEEALLTADVGVSATDDIVSRLRQESTRQALPDAAAVLGLLGEMVAAEFGEPASILEARPATVLFVGVNGAGKTTSVGKIAKQAKDGGANVVLGSADTFRAAAAEQLDVWAQRAGVPVVRRDRGADPAAVAFETVEYAENNGCDLALIDTAGRLHTSADLMRELAKVKRVTVNRSKAPVYTLLVLDATTGQNGLNQAREFNAALELDGVVLTKLDGTARGGITIAIARELGLPIVRLGVGESLEDLRPFDAREFAQALIGG